MCLHCRTPPLQVSDFNLFWVRFFSLFHNRLIICSCHATVPTRLEYIKVNPKSDVNQDVISGPLSKKPRIERIEQSTDNKNNCHHTLDEVEQASIWLDSLLRQ
jgi:hypothetical protein